MSNAVDHDESRVDMTADTHDVPYGGSRFTLWPDASGYRFTGIDPLGIAGPHREIVVQNMTTETVVIAHDDAGSTEGNRFFMRTGLDLTLQPYEQRWALRTETLAGRVGWWVEG
jgi:hypothetical protein